jgi:hypothetical protein
MALLKSRKNELHKTLTSLGLNPADFEWQMRERDQAGWVSSADADTLVHRSTGFFFMVFSAPQAPGMSEYSKESTAYGDYVVMFEPGVQSHRERTVGISWEWVEMRFRDWLNNVHREMIEPDLWAQVTATEPADIQVLLAKVEEDEDNTPFSLAERQRIAGTLEEIKDHLAARYDLKAEQIEVVRDGFARLIVATERLGRRDWKGVFVQALLGIAVKAALTSPVATALVHIALQGFNWLLEHGRLLSP